MSDAILKGLAKNPAERFDNCVAFAQAVLAAVSSASGSSSASLMTSLTSRGEPGRVPCPACHAPMPVGREHCGGRVRCTRCQATSLVSLLSSNTIQLKLLSPVTLPSGSPAAIVVEGPDGEPELDPSAATVVAEKPPAFVTRAALRAGFSRRSDPGGRDRRCAVLVGLIALAFAAVGRGPWSRPTPVPLGKSPSDTLAAAPPAVPLASVVEASEADTVEINVAYGTEKQQWLEERDR